MVTQQSADELSWMKASQRASANRVRQKEHDLSQETASAKLASFGLDFLQVEQAAVVSGYHPYRTEIDVLPLMERLDGEGRKLCLPVVIENERPLEFRRWQPGGATERGQLNIEVPLEGTDVVEPDVLLVPLLAFDDRGYRLGYGGGFYDRTLQLLRSKKPVIAVGVAFAAQEVGAVVRGFGDQALDWILTENGPMQPSRN